MKTYKEYRTELHKTKYITEADKWFPVSSDHKVQVGDYLRTADGLVKVEATHNEYGTFYGKIITAIHDDVVKGETYEYRIDDVQVLANKKDKHLVRPHKISKSGKDDLLSIEDEDARHKSPALHNPITINPVMEMMEKYLSNDDIYELIDKVISSASAVQKTHKDSEERKKAKGVIKWAGEVRKTLEDEGKLHPQVILSLMRSVAGTSSKNKSGWGYRTKGWTTRGDGKVPASFANESLDEGLTQSLARGLALGVKRKAIAYGNNVEGTQDVAKKIDYLSKQVSAVAALALLATAVSGDGLLSKAGVVSGLFSEYQPEYKGNTKIL